MEPTYELVKILNHVWLLNLDLIGYTKFIYSVTAIDLAISYGIKIKVNILLTISTWLILLQWKRIF